MIANTLSKTLLALAALVPMPLAWGQPPAHIDLAAPQGEEGAQTFRVLGAAAQEGNAAAAQERLTAGDFNGDGFDDLLALQGDRAFIVYGSADSAGAALDLTGDAAGVTTITGPTPFLAATASDFDEDGIDDAVLCVVDELFIVYGAEAKLGTPAGSGSELSLVAAAYTGIAGVTRLPSNSGGGEFNWLKTGDFNADGLLDLAHGDGLYNVLHVLYGMAGRWGEPLGNGYLMQVPYSIVGWPNVTAVYDFPGLLSALAVGDFDGDGYDDLAMGIGNANVQTKVDAGIVIVIYGQPAQWLSANPGDPFQYTLSSSTNDTVSIQGELRILGDGAHDHMGAALASTDLNADGYADLVIGAPGATNNGATNAGEIYVLYGAPERPGAVSGAGRRLDLETTGEPSAAGETRILGPMGNAGLGTVLAACDWNGDGLGDIALGMPGADAPGRPGAGMVNVLYGAAQPLGIPFGAGSILNLYNESADVEILGPNADAALGTSLLGSLDFNRDGFPDLVAGAAVDTAASTPSFGSVNLIFGELDSISAVASVAFVDAATPVEGLGGTLAPALRARLAFDEGEGNLATIQLIRDAGSVITVPQGATLPPLWQLSTARAGWQSATLTVQYTDADLGGAAEDTLAAWTAPTPEGPWTQPAQSQVLATNTITLELTAPGYVVLASSNLAVSIARAPEQEPLTGTLPLVFQITFSEPVTGLDLEDFSYQGTALVQSAEISGSGMHYELHITAMDRDGSVRPILRSGAAQNSVGQRTAQAVPLDDGVRYGGREPVITLKGEASQKYYCPESFVETGFTAWDDLEGDLTALVQWSDQIKHNAIHRVYTVTDSFGITGSVTRVLEAYEYYTPTVSLNGDATVYLACNAPFVESGATALDRCTQEPLTVTLPRSPNTAIAGEQTLYYRATDRFGRGTYARRTIIVLEDAPSALYLLGDSVVELLCYVPFEDPGAVAIGPCSDNITNLIQRTGTIDRKTPGTYTLEYSVQVPGSEEILSVTRTVNVVPPCPSPFHTADQNQSNTIELFELLRVAQFYNLKGYHCAATPTEDGFQPGPGDDHNCNPHDADYVTQDWKIGLSEILRVIQFFYLGAYHRCDEGEDGFCLDNAGLAGNNP